jgi:hypothetical protein
MLAPKYGPGAAWLGVDWGVDSTEKLASGKR